MKTVLQTYILALNTSGADGAPEWLQLVPAGSFSGVDGRGPFVNERPEEVVAVFTREGRKLPVDENHATELAPRFGNPSPARGWIVAMEVRNGSIWGRVEWTESGASMMADKAYGFLSPVFLHPAKPPFTVTRLTSVALTNNPNLTQLKSLHSQQETEMLEQLRKLFGLPDTADEATVLAAVTSMHSANQAHVVLMARIAETAGVAANSAGDAIVTALQSAITKPAPTGDAAKITELEGQVTALHNQLSSYVKVTSEDKAKAVIEQAITAGKIVPALRDHYVARHVKDAAEVEKEISLLPSLHAGGLGGRQPPKTVEGADLSAEDVSIMALMGVDAKAFTETHKSLHGKAA